jgi:Family of unknown function (DUF5652)
MTYTLTTAQVTVFVIVMLWELAWKGLALWRAAQQSQRIWFIALLVINSAGILPIGYLLVTSFSIKEAVET